jgi:hypothetical protein
MTQQQKPAEAKAMLDNLNLDVFALDDLMLNRMVEMRRDFEKAIEDRPLLPSWTWKKAKNFAIEGILSQRVAGYDET